MKFSKYSETDNAIIGSYSSTSSSSETTETTTQPSRSGDRKLWGNDDNGGDIYETLFVDGSLYLNGNPDYADENGDDDDDKEAGESRTFTPEDDDEGGNIYAKGKVKADKVEANEVYGKQLYLNYPTATDAKTDVAPLLKNHADTLANHETRITTNATNITNLTSTVNNHTTQIGNLTATVANHTTQINNLQTSVTNNTTNITTNTNDITDIKNRLDNLDTTTGGTTTDLTNLTTQVNTNTTNITDLTTRVEALENGEGGVSQDAFDALERLVKCGDYSHPICLFAGRMRKSTVSNSNYWFVEGLYASNMTMSGSDAAKGVLTVTMTPYNGWVINVTSVSVNQLSSEKLGTNPDDNDIKGRSTGAHWFGAFFTNATDKSTIYLREFHQGNGDNDTWYNDNWPALKEVNVQIYGYMYQNVTYNLLPNDYSDEPTAEDDEAREAMERAEFAALTQTDQTE